MKQHENMATRVDANCCSLYSFKELCLASAIALLAAWSYSWPLVGNSLDPTVNLDHLITRPREVQSSRRRNGSNLAAFPHLLIFCPRFSHLIRMYGNLGDCIPRRSNASWQHDKAISKTPTKCSLLFLRHGPHFFKDANDSSTSFYYNNLYDLEYNHERQLPLSRLLGNRNSALWCKGKGVRLSDIYMKFSPNSAFPAIVLLMDRILMKSPLETLRDPLASWDPLV